MELILLPALAHLVSSGAILTRDRCKGAKDRNVKSVRRLPLVSMRERWPSAARTACLVRDLNTDYSKTANSGMLGDLEISEVGFARRGFVRPKHQHRAPEAEGISDSARSGGDVCNGG